MCHFLKLGKFDNIQYTHRYFLYDDELEHVFEEKDLGVIKDMELSFEESKWDSGTDSENFQLP